jgi:NADH-quinone oxidoreductase subunit E
MTRGKENGITVEKAVRESLEYYGENAEDLIPILSKVNNELGFLPKEAMKTISEKLRIPQSQLYSVATFYKMLFTREMGRHVVKFCESAPCHVAGGRQIWTSVKDLLHLQPGETSPDGKWSLITVSCLGICASGPVMIIDEDAYGNLTAENLPSIFARYQ